VAERTAVKTAQELLSDASKYLAGGVLHHATALRDRPPIIVARASGSRIWDVSGNSYIDYYMGSASLPLGHAHPEVIQAVSEQEALGTHSFELTPPAIELAKLIVEMVPGAERIKYATSGTEAVLAAVRAARRQVAKVRAQETAVTIDGARIEVFANLGSAADARIAVAEGAEGCGLLRTEFLFLDRAAAPDEEEQRAAGVAPEMVRLSIGLETLDDILWDIDQALEAGT